MTKVKIYVSVSIISLHELNVMSNLTAVNFVYYMHVYKKWEGEDILQVPPSPNLKDPHDGV
jgi:hypothetical protein